MVANGYTKAGRLRRKKGDAKILAEACPTSETEPDGGCARHKT